MTDYETGYRIGQWMGENVFFIAIILFFIYIILEKIYKNIKKHINK